MADHLITITNSLRCFGLEKASQWGQTEYPYTFVWGTTPWGYGYTIPLDVQKNIENTLEASGVYAGSLMEKLIENSMPMSFETDMETLANGSWNVVFSSDTTDAEDRDFPSWTSQSAGSLSYTCQVAGSTTWS